MKPPKLTKNNALFLDFDGCLVEFGGTSDSVLVPPELHIRLNRLHEWLGGAVALNSGRSVSNLRQLLPDFPGAISGDHGTEIALPGAPIETVDLEGLDVAALHARSGELTSHSSALTVECKAYGIVVSYRADPSLADWVFQAVQKLAADFPMLCVLQAKGEYELRPRNAGKGQAVARLVETPIFAGRIPVHAGDDVADEAAMAEAQKLGGYGVKVGEGDTVGLHRLPNPTAVAEWLDSSLHN